MNIILFEGIASSGKTTIEKMLLERISNAEMITEDKTLMPIIDNKDAAVALAYLNGLLSSIRASQKETTIIDRFHFTHAFRTKSALSAFSQIEQELLDLGNVLVVLLTIDPEQIHGRIEETIQHRKDGWTKGAQGTIDEKVSYYFDQQEKLISLAANSRLQVIKIDTTGKDWGSYLDAISQQVTRYRNEI